MEVSRASGLRSLRCRSISRACTVRPRRGQFTIGPVRRGNPEQSGKKPFEPSEMMELHQFWTSPLLPNRVGGSPAQHRVRYDYFDIIGLVGASGAHSKKVKRPKTPQPP